MNRNRVGLNVTREESTAARRAGARWDAYDRIWYFEIIEAHTTTEDLERVRRWMDQRTQTDLDTGALLRRPTAPSAITPPQAEKETPPAPTAPSTQRQRIDSASRATRITGTTGAATFAAQLAKVRELAKRTT